MKQLFFGSKSCICFVDVGLFEKRDIRDLNSIYLISMTFKLFLTKV